MTRFSSNLANFLGVVGNSFDDDEHADTVSELNRRLFGSDSRPTIGLPTTGMSAGARSVPSTPIAISPTSLFAPYFAQNGAAATSSKSPVSPPANESSSANGNMGANNTGAITSHVHLRRASESVHNTHAEDDYFASRKPLARRYTLPSIVGGVINNGGAGKDGTDSRPPMTPFWEAGAREDSAVQATMANVFGF